MGFSSGAGAMENVAEIQLLTKLVTSAAAKVIVVAVPLMAIVGSVPKLGTPHCSLAENPVNPLDPATPVQGKKFPFSEIVPKVFASMLSGTRRVLEAPGIMVLGRQSVFRAVASSCCRLTQGSAMRPSSV